ncbi:hypothetical protein L6V77_24170 [Myxococcota bacterium]|nr:hypothetical protein [Myxococcota bacterium]
MAMTLAIRRARWPASSPGSTRRGPSQTGTPRRGPCARAVVGCLDAELATLDGLRVDLVWDHLTPLNRQRLVRAMVTEGRVDAAAGAVTARLVDLGLEDERAAS